MLYKHLSVNWKKILLKISGKDKGIYVSNQYRIVNVAVTVNTGNVMKIWNVHEIKILIASILVILQEINISNFAVYFD